MSGVNTSKFEDIKYRIKNNAAVSGQELVDLLNYDHAELFDFMLLNNPSNVNYTLKYIIGFTKLPFTPNLNMLHGQIEAMIAKNDRADLQKIYDNFKFNCNADNFTTHPDIMEAFRKSFPPGWFSKCPGSGSGTSNLTVEGCVGRGGEVVWSNASAQGWYCRGGLNASVKK